MLMAGPPVCGRALAGDAHRGDVAGSVFAAAAHQLELARSLRDYRRAARNLARVLLEPGETAFPHLRQHSQATSEISQRMVAILRLPEDQDELITVAAYLHDVGMRELDYARVYRLERPGEPEQPLCTIGTRWWALASWRPPSSPATSRAPSATITSAGTAAATRSTSQDAPFRSRAASSTSRRSTTCSPRRRPTAASCRAMPPST